MESIGSQVKKNLLKKYEESATMTSKKAGSLKEEIKDNMEFTGVSDGIHPHTEFIDPQRTKVTLKDLPEFPTSMPDFDTLEKAPLAAKQDFEPAVCPLCGVPMELVDNESIYTCPDCPAILFEYHGEDDYINLGVYLGHADVPKFKGITEDATVFDIFQAVLNLQKQELHFESAVKSLLHNSLNDWKQQAESSTDPAVKLVYREYKNISSQLNQLFRADTKIDTPVGRDGGWVKRLNTVRDEN